MSKQAGRMSQGANDFLAPYAPTIGTATDVGTSRAYNDGAATVTFTADPRNAATSFTVTSSPGGFVGTGASSPITVTGLQSATDYTFTVTATNDYGTSVASSATASMTATTVPATPTAPSASTVSNQTQDSVSWAAPANGGKSISNYHWESDDSKSGDTASTSVTVSQEAGTAQSYRVYATNANGNSAWSGYSSQVTTFSFVPYSFVPYSFTPFAFTPFAFTPYAFTPTYSFTPYAFTPYAFTPTYSFTPYSFVPYSFVPYAFTPLKVCIDQDTLIQIVGENDSVDFKAAKDIVVGDKIWSIHWTGLQDESIDPHAEAVYPESLDGIVRVHSEIIAIDPSVKDTTLYFNGDKGKRFTAEEKVLVKRANTHVFVEAKTITTEDSIFEATQDGMVETPVTSVEYIEETRNVFKFNAFPVDTIIAGNMVVHNSKVF